MALHSPIRVYSRLFIEQLVCSFCCVEYDHGRRHDLEINDIGIYDEIVTCCPDGEDFTYDIDDSNRCMSPFPRCLEYQTRFRRWELF